MITREGTKPPDADGVIYDSPNDNRNDALYGWRIYRRKTNESFWINMKVVSQRPRPGAANYWLSWSMQDKRFNHSRDAYRIPEAMRERIMVIMRDYGNAAWNLSDADVRRTLAEIEAQEAALA